MENYDKAKAARVWQRVQGAAAEDPARGLPGLIAEEWADAAVYLALSRRVQGQPSAVLKKMSQEEQAHMACLKGIYKLQNAGQPDVPAPSPTDKAPVSTLLRRCYGREMRCLAVYEAHGADPEYGPVFLQLAREEKEHCRNILHLIGKLDPK